MAEHAIRPVPMPCLRSRRSNCFCCFKPLFGEPQQMGNVLGHTFQGEHRWITHTSPGKTVIDAMFFAANTDVVDDSDTTLGYKD